MTNCLAENVPGDDVCWDDNFDEYNTPRNVWNVAASSFYYLDQNNFPIESNKKCADHSKTCNLAVRLSKKK